MIWIGLGNIFHLSLRATSLRDLFFNWDLDIGPLGISYCWCRQHRLGISWRLMKKRDGKRRWTGLHRYWALGHIDVFDKPSQLWVKSRGPLWRWAWPDRYHGEVMVNGLDAEAISYRPKISVDLPWIWHSIKFWWLRFSRRRFRRSILVV